MILAEVLSDSTESYDRGVKFGHYRKLESLVEYLLVGQDDYRIEQYVRQAEGPWLRSDLRGLNASLDLPSIQCSLKMADIYERVTLP